MVRTHEVDSDEEAKILELGRSRKDGMPSDWTGFLSNDLLFILSKNTYFSRVDGVTWTGLYPYPTWC